MRYKKNPGFRAIFFAVGCAATTGVKSIGNDTYAITVSRGDMSKVKQRAYEHAIRFCSEQKTQGIEVINENLRPDLTTPNSSGGIIDLKFKCGGPLVQNNSKTTQDSSLKQIQPVPPQIQPAQPSGSSSLQTTDSSKRLVELKRLLDQGLINQKDYDSKKAEILKGM